MMRLIALLSLVAASGCAAPSPAPLFGAPAKLAAGDYPEVLERWTRSDKVYGGFDTRMFVSGTFHTPELRRAFAAAFPEVHGHGGNITRRELVDLTGDVEQFHNFFLSVYTADDKWNDLAMPDSIWHLSLIGSGEVAVNPAKVEIVSVDANLRAVYPYISRFDKAYLVRFPLADAMGRLVLDPHSTSATLRIASALGVAELVWDLAPATGARDDAGGVSVVAP